MRFGKSNRRDRKRSALRESLTRQQAIFSSPLVGILTIDEHGRIDELNTAAKRMFGWKKGARPPDNITQIIDFGTSGPIAIDQILVRLAEQGEEACELVGKRKDGSTFPIDFALADMAAGKRGTFIVFVRDISKRKRNEALKDEFVATVSHELRTPLTSIAGSLGLLVGGAAGTFSPSASRLIEIAHDNSKRLVRLINNILDLEKIESGSAEFDFQPHDLRALIAQAIEANRGLDAYDQVRMRLDAHADTAIVKVDSDRIIQIVTNLLSNAKKFSPAHSEVLISIRHRGPTVRVSVRDHGPGVPSVFKPRIFQKFAQADGRTAARKLGTGLGLNIVKQLVHSHGGTVGFEDAADGGTIFYFDLPCMSGWNDADAPAATGGRPEGDRRLRILHLDDDRDILEVVAAALGIHVDVVSACSLREARLALGKGDVDIALIDLVLGDENGLDLLDDLHKPSGEAIPAIILSGREAEAAIAAHVDAVFTKDRASLDRLPEVLQRLTSRDRSEAHSGAMIAHATP